RSFAAAETPPIRGDRPAEATRSNPLAGRRSRRAPMQPFRTILVAADFSENSVHALRMACALAIEDKTRLVVLHVAAPQGFAEQRPPPGESAAAPARASRMEDRLRILKGRMRELYSPSRPIDAQYRTAAGDDAATGILRVANEVGADLIVMGA